MNAGLDPFFIGAPLPSSDVALASCPLPPLVRRPGLMGARIAVAEAMSEESF